MKRNELKKMKATLCAVLALVAAANAAPHPGNGREVRKSTIEKKASYEQSAKACGNGKHVGAIVHLNKAKVKDVNTFKDMLMAHGHGDDIPLVRDDTPHAHHLSCPTRHALTTH